MLVSRLPRGAAGVNRDSPSCGVVATQGWLGGQRGRSYARPSAPRCPLKGASAGGEGGGDDGGVIAADDVAVSVPDLDDGLEAQGDARGGVARLGLDSQSRNRTRRGRGRRLIGVLPLIEDARGIRDQDVEG